jgi:hypothetical protein
MPGVPRRKPYDQTAVHDLLRAQERIATHAQLVELGMPLSTITRWIGPRGPWQRLFPGVVLAHTGTPTRREVRLGALMYAGTGSVLSGLTGLRVHRVKSAERPGEEVAHILVPHERRRSGHHLAVVERTRHLPEPTTIQRLRVAPVARCLVDACRRTRQLDDIRALVSDAVQSGRCAPGDIVEALRRANRQRTALTREAIREIDAGLRSVAEVRASTAILASDLPVPLFNPKLYLPDGTFVASPDGYFEHCAAAYEVDSFAYHFDRGSYLRTQQRQRRVMGHGIMSIGVSPVDIYDDPSSFIEDLRALIFSAEQRATPDIIVRSADGR